MKWLFSFIAIFLLIGGSPLVNQEDDGSEDEGPRHGKDAKCHAFCVPHEPTEKRRKQWQVPDDMAIYVCKGPCVIHGHEPDEEGNVEEHQVCQEHRREAGRRNCGEYCRSH